MLGVVITGHGKFASGLLQAVEQVIGQQKQCVAIDFPEGMSMEYLSESLRDACQCCDSGAGVVILTDLLGGSPFRQAAQLALTYPSWEVITGINMQLAAEMMLERDNGLSTTEFRDLALECGHRGLTSLWHEQQKQQNKSCDDGI
ncbi:PTS galactosamine/N-acetylgalactosamine transporter subunit IIA [Xenorhabdus littoralis]|uniref:PTS galactosamine/N-acetylgalactosamine transporter subunit IIA n=1 Tax=Xenorhabdus littoralis TaxID=2582835 RepID=UPI0029E80D19|nr:PTS galactosamine/N-acetylgalactosamine transporter subunit IIA [Xenorhabdus sp. psl]MDX7992858.1 PTS sugar transporter subunit IIA [Xenorhabdus sp. psl]